MMNIPLDLLQIGGKAEERYWEKNYIKGPSSKDKNMYP